MTILVLVADFSDECTKDGALVRICVNVFDIKLQSSSPFGRLNS